MAEIRWTEEAVKWLRNIYDYISEENPIAAQNVIEGIYEKTQILESFPEIGYEYGSERDGQIRILLYGHYRIAYTHQTRCCRNSRHISRFNGNRKVHQVIKG